MGNRSWLLVVLPLLGGCPLPPSQDTPVPAIRKLEPRTDSEYYLYVPSTYNAQRAWPMVVTIHGAHGFDSAYLQAKEWKGLAEKQGFIVLAPQLDSPLLLAPAALSVASRLKTLQEDERKVLAMVAEAKRQYRISDKEVMLTAFSAGGYALYYIGLRNPNVFRVLAARSADFDMDTIKDIEITERIRLTPICIFYGRTGVNPFYSGHNPIATESWTAYRYLNEHRCSDVKIRAVEGGHERRPDVAYDFWFSKQSGIRPKKTADGALYH